MRELFLYQAFHGLVELDDYVFLLCFLNSSCRCTVVLCIRKLECLDDVLVPGIVLEVLDRDLICLSIGQIVVQFNCNLPAVLHQSHHLLRPLSYRT